MRKLSFWRTISLVCVFCVVGPVAASAVTLTTLANFDGTDGQAPEYGPLVQGFDGKFYGTTYEGGTTSGLGTVFKITAGGTLTLLHSFPSISGDGAVPYDGLVLATNGKFYGTTSEGGANSVGTIFESTGGGTVTTIYSFCSQMGCTDGSSPAAGLVRTNIGNFYGTTTTGGVNACGNDGCGTVFEFTAGHKLITLHTFGGPDGAEPWGTLVQATDGNFYGTTYFGGANDVSTCAGFGPNLVGCGTVFRITPGGKLTTLHSFDFTDGAGPVAVLVQGTNGNLYGTASYGGTSTACSVGCGTVFEITLKGKLTTLHRFDDMDGASPDGGLAQATNGNLYGATELGGTSTTTCSLGCGTVFEITPESKLTTLHRFDGTDGYAPGSTLLQATNGTLYGTTVEGGDYGDGTVFSLSVGLGPFVETLPTLGVVGEAVIILGNNLTSAISVTFNGTPATFTVVSNTKITTTVPSGATTGQVKVTTPSRTLISNVNFRVS